MKSLRSKNEDVTTSSDDTTSTLAATSESEDREEYFNSSIRKREICRSDSKARGRETRARIVQFLETARKDKSQREQIMREALDLYRLAAAAGSDKARRAAAALLSHEYVYHAGGGFVYKGQRSIDTSIPTSATKSPLAMKASSRAAYHRLRGAYLGDNAMQLSVTAVGAMRRKNWGEKSCLFASQYLFLAATKAYEEYNKPSGQVRIEKQRLHDRLKINFRPMTPMTMKSSQ